MEIKRTIAGFFQKYRPTLRRFLLWGTVAAFVVLFLLLSLVALLPAIASSQLVQKQLRQTVSTKLKRQISWSQMLFSWGDGIHIRELSLGPGQAPLLEGYVGDVHISPRIESTDGHKRFFLKVQIRSVTARLAPGKAKPPAPFREPLAAIADGLQKFEKISWPLPLDIGMQLSVEPVSLAYLDPQNSRKLTLDNLSLNLDMPSLATKPVRAEISGTPALDGHPLEKIAFSACLKGMVDNNSKIRPSVAVIDLNGALPGIKLSFNGGLNEPAGFAARARVNLPDLMTSARPFLPSDTPVLKGELLFDLKAKADPARNILASADLHASRLAIIGGKLRKGRIGPIGIGIHQKISSDHQRQQVRFTDGSVAIGTIVSGRWEATVDRPASRDRKVSARIGPARIDLKQAVLLAAPFLPPKFPLKEMAGELQLQEIRTSLHGPGNNGELELAGLALNMPLLLLDLPGKSVSLAGTDVAIAKATMPIKASKPTSIEANILYALDKCTVTGSAPMTVESLKGDLQVGVAKLDLKSRSPRKFAALINLKQSLGLHRATMDGKLALSGVNEHLEARINANENGDIELSLPALKLTADTFKAMSSGKETKPVPLAADLSATGIVLSAKKGSPLKLENTSFSLVSGETVKLAGTARLSDSLPQQLISEGSLGIDLKRIIPVIAQFLPKGTEAGGVSNLAWNLAAPINQKPKPKNKNPIQAARAAIAMLNRSDISLKLENSSFTWPSANGPISVSGLASRQPLRFTVSGNGSSIIASGDIAFSNLKGISGKSEELPPLSGSFSLRGQLDEWRLLRLHESLSIKQFGLAQKSDATFSKIDLLLEKTEPLSASSILKHLDGELSSEISAAFPDILTPVPGGLELAGSGSAGLRLNLSSGRELRIRATATPRDFSARLKNGTTAEGVNADLLIDRTYKLASRNEAAWTPLSASLLSPAKPRATAAASAEIVNRVREDMGGQEFGSQKFTIRRITARTARTPVELTSLEGVLLLNPERTGLSFLQAELLGGTIRMHGLMDLRPEVPQASAACTFSNIETLLLLPPDIRKKESGKNQDTGITGEAFFDAPLLTGQRELLEGIRMRINLRKIGADTLERALFSLDPYEQNEQIVAQRKLLRNGRLNSMQANTLDGSFSLDGEVQIKGVNISMPRVERIRLSDMQLDRQMEKAVAGVAATRKLLDLLRADTLIVRPDGKIELIRRGDD